MSIVVPPNLDEVRRRLRPAIAELPVIVAEWPRGSGRLADVPLLGPGDLAPRAFDSVAGTVRVAATTAELVTVAGLLEMSSGGLLVTVSVVSPTDLSLHTAQARGREAALAARSRQILAEAGARSDGLMVEVAVLIGSVGDDDGAPVAGVGVVRPLVFADPSGFPHPGDKVRYGPDVLRAARTAMRDDSEMLSDLGGPPLTPIAPDLARIWGPLFAVGRSATVGLAARTAWT